MARTKEFSPDTALTRAMDLFWCRGYEATSVEDLLEGMGIGRGSLYGTFGDKRALFLAALDRYRDEQAGQLIRALDEAPSVREALRDVFERVVQVAAADPRRRGCLMANTAVELAPHDPEVAERVRANAARIEEVFVRALARGQAAGDIGDRHDPRALARFLINSFQGLQVMARAGSDRSTLEDVVGVTLAALD